MCASPVNYHAAFERTIERGPHEIAGTYVITVVVDENHFRMKCLSARWQGRDKGILVNRHAETVKVVLTPAKCRTTVFLCEWTTHKAKMDVATADGEELYEKFSTYVVNKGSKDSKTLLRGLSEI